MTEKHDLTDDAIEAIAERAAEIAVKKAAESFYENIGRGLVTKVLLAIGLLAVGFLSAKGIRFP